MARVPRLRRPSVSLLYLDAESIPDFQSASVFLQTSLKPEHCRGLLRNRSPVFSVAFAEPRLHAPTEEQREDMEFAAHLVELLLTRVLWILMGGVRRSECSPWTRFRFLAGNQNDQATERVHWCSTAVRQGLCASDLEAISGVNADLAMSLRKPGSLSRETVSFVLSESEEHSARNTAARNPDALLSSERAELVSYLILSTDSKDQE